MQSSKLIYMAITTHRKGIITDRYKAFLDIVSAFHGIKLSGMEKKVLNGFFWQSNGKINTGTRKAVAGNLKISSYNLTNQILKLRRKKLIIPNKANKEEDILVDSLIPDIEADKRSFVIQLELVS